jgi:hypothetical protein
MAIELEVGKVYMRGDDRAEEIGGVTRDYPGWVWSIGGNWYEKATGRFVSYSSGHWGRPMGHFLMPEDSQLNLVRELPNLLRKQAE